MVHADLTKAQLLAKNFCICIVKEIVYAKDRRIIGYISVNIYREIKLNREDRVAAASHEF